MGKSKNKEAIIYTLSFPDSDVVFYVGSTIVSLRQRLACHLLENGLMSDDFKQIINELKSRGQQPKIEEIEKVEAKDRNAKEEYWIQQFRSWGFPLINKYYKKGIGARVRFTSNFSQEETRLIDLLYRNGDNEIISKRIGIGYSVVCASRIKKRCEHNVRKEIVAFYLERAKEVIQIHGAIN